MDISFLIPKFIWERILPVTHPYILIFSKNEALNKALSSVKIDILNSLFMHPYSCNATKAYDNELPTPSICLQSLYIPHLISETSLACILLFWVNVVNGHHMIKVIDDYTNWIQNHNLSWTTTFVSLHRTNQMIARAINNSNTMQSKFFISMYVQYKTSFCKAGRKRLLF